MCHVLLTDIKTKLEELTVQIESINAGFKTYMNVEEAAKYLSISKSTLYKHTCSGNIAYFKPNGKLILFNKEDLDTWINRLKVPANNDLLTPKA